MHVVLLLPSLLALFLSVSLASPVAPSMSQAVLTSGPISSLAIPSSLYEEFVQYTKYSSAAYRYSNPIYRRICRRPLGNTLVRVFERGRTQSFIARDKNRKEIVVVFRGTFDLKDAISDLKFRKVPFESPGISEPVRVHRGFLAAYNDVVDEVLTIVKQQLEDFPSYSIVVTGHSLGGAVASLAAPSIKTAHPEVPLKLYTFGQPRVGTSKFATYVEDTIGVDNIFRVVHTRGESPPVVTFLSLTQRHIPLDRVPMVPKVNYEHFGTEYWQFRDPIPWITPPHETVKKCDGRQDPECSLSNVFTHIIPFHTFYFGHVMSVPMAKFAYCL